MIHKWKIKRGDHVVVIAGNAKNKKGRILQVIKSKESVIIEGVNMVRYHKKVTSKSAGGIIEKEAPVHLSNISLIDSKTGNPSRIGFVKDSKNKQVRYFKSSGEKLDN